MECTGHLPTVTAIFPPDKSGKGSTAKFASTKLLNNQLGPGMIDRCVQVPRSLRLMCPVSWNNMAGCCSCSGGHHSRWPICRSDSSWRGRECCEGTDIRRLDVLGSNYLIVFSFLQHFFLRGFCSQTVFVKIEGISVPLASGMLCHHFGLLLLGCDTFDTIH